MKSVIKFFIKLLTKLRKHNLRNILIKYLVIKSFSNKVIHKYLNIEVKDLIPEIIKDTNNLILVFDDIERTALPIKEVIGYINYFIEIYKLNVIVVANEKKIEDSEFKEFKEKFIGKTYTINQDIHTIYDAFIENTNCQMLLGNKNHIIDIYNLSKYNNLRSLKLALQDFSHLITRIKEIDSNFTQNEQFIKELIRVFFGFFFEIKSGTIDKNYLELLYGSATKWKKESAKLENVLNKYSIKSFYLGVDFLLGIENIIDILCNGKIITANIKNSIEESSFFIHNKTENYVKLWHYIDLENDEFNEIITNTWNEFQELKYQDEYKLLHIIGLFLFFISIDLFEKDEQKILNIATKTIDKNISQLANTIERVSTLGYYAVDNPIFKKIKKLLHSKIEQQKKENHTNNFFNEFEKLKDCDYQDTNIKDSIGYNKKVFNTNDVDRFIEILKQIKHKNIQYFANILRERDSDIIQTEIDFWKNIVEKLENDTEIQGLKSYLITKEFANHINQILKIK
jgi:hypothetical protein